MRTEKYPYAIIISLYILGLIIFLPKIHYPYGDSWFYMRNVYDSLESGRVTFTDAQAATPLFQVWLGEILCKLSGGFGMLKLNLLAYFFSFLAAIYAYRLIRLFTHTASLAILGVVLLIAIPPFFKTSLAFMTDSFFCFGMFMAFYHGVKYIRAQRKAPTKKADIEAFNWDALLTAIGFSIAVLNRVNAFISCLAFLLFVYIYSKKRRPSILEWIAHISPIIIFIAFEIWMKKSGTAPYYLSIYTKHVFMKNLYTGLATKEIIHFIPGKVALLAKWAGYFGVLLLPVTIWITRRSFPKWRGGKDAGIGRHEARLIWLVLTPAIIITTLVLVASTGIKAIIPNTITEFGLGVKGVILPGVQPLFGENFFTILQILLIIGGIMLGLSTVGRVLEGKGSNDDGIFAWWMIVSTALFPLLAHDFSDRYLIPIFPLIFILLVQGGQSKKYMPRWAWIYPIVLLISVGLLAAEYFGWNTARWKAIESAIADGEIDLKGWVDKEWKGPFVDGGLEFDTFRYFNNRKYLEYYKEPWERGGSPPTTAEQMGLPPVPGYTIWWNLPKHYDYIVREEFGAFPMTPAEEASTIGERVGSASYRPYPWSKPKTLVVYKPPSGYP